MRLKVASHVHHVVRKSATEFEVDGVAGAGVIQLKTEEFGGGQAVSGAAEGDAGGGEEFQVNSHGVGLRAGMDSSQASNSGAGLRPRVERT